MQLINRIAATVICCLLGGCGVSPHTNYYVLNSLTPLQDAQETSISLGVGPVMVAEYLDRVQITLRDGNAIQLDEFNRWGEPLTQGIKRVLMEELAAQLHTVNLVQFPWRADAIPELRVKMVVLELNRVGDRAYLKAGWSLTRTSSSEILRQGVESLEQPLAGNGYDALVDSYSQMLQQLASTLAEHIRQANDDLDTPASATPPS